MFCHNCGKEILEDAKYCVNCGAKFVCSKDSTEKTQTNPLHKHESPATTSDVNVASLNIAAAAINSKNLGISLLLTLFFGPLGMLYSTIIGGLLMLILPIPVFMGMFSSNVGFAFGLVFFIFYWLICIVWGMIAANNHNKTLLLAVAQGVGYEKPFSFKPVLIVLAFVVIASVLISMSKSHNEDKNTNLNDSATKKSTNIDSNTITTEIPSVPSPKIKIIFDEMLGKQVPYFEKIYGPAMEVNDNEREYKIDGTCNLTVTTKGSKIVGLRIWVGNNVCKMNINMGGNYKSISSFKVGDYVNLASNSKTLDMGHFEYYCFPECGNVADPRVRLVVQGSHGENYVDTRVIVEEGTNEYATLRNAILGVNNYLDLSFDEEEAILKREGIGEGAARMAFIKIPKLDQISATVFKENKILAYEIGWFN
jgi:hypothetical protein